MVELSTLPPPLRRWLARALPTEPKQLPRHVHVTQVGALRVRPGAPWAPWRAVEILEVERLAFDWTARMRLGPLLWAELAQGYRDGRGWESARMWGVVRMLNEDGPAVVRRQAIRALADLVWAPQAVLGNDGLEWEAAGNDAFQVRAGRWSPAALARFEVDALGDVIRVSAPDRPKNAVGEEAPFRYDLLDHAVIGGARVPRHVEASFELSHGAFVYWRCDTEAVVLEP